ncbi:MAG: hypothetical protein RMN52_14255 [Anaerolineae bacterium]|nr:hypothetical protein [Candidatus Roseilinea sp.]MDW8451158.1 hypothetical protein [Anaerolineae bacterium]
MHLTSAQRAGEFKPGDARVMTLAAWALAHGLATLMLDDRLPRDIPAERLTRACATLLLDGMRRPA